MPILTSLEQDDTYLDYALSTAPSTVAVSEDPTALSYATLTIVISNPAPDPTVTITVSEITFNVPVGTDGPSLASAGGFGYSVSDTDQKDAWSLAPSGSDGFFTLTPKDPTSPGIVVDAQGIVVTFSKIQVNQVEGTASITIHETATCKVAPPTPQPPQPSGDCTINVPKFPYGFAVSDFALAAP